jgi:hypothetical protein
MRIRAPFPIHETAKITGGRLITLHGHNCLSRRTLDDSDCGCNPSFKLWRQPRKSRGR